MNPDKNNTRIFKSPALDATPKPLRTRLAKTPTHRKELAQHLKRAVAIGGPALKAPNGQKKRPSRGGNFSKRSPKRFRRSAAPTISKKDKERAQAEQSVKDLSAMKRIPQLASGDLRIVPVCGLEWVGTNMSFIEYKDEIIVIDCGFAFSTPDTPGINYRLPNISYLRANKHKIKALVITHGHLDHVGAIPFLIEELGFPPIYTREFGAMFIKKKFDEYPDLQKKVTIEIVEAHMGSLTLGEYLKVEFFGLTHSIPDSTGVIIDTPLGGIVSTGDVRVENNDGIVKQSEIDQYAFFKDRDILLMTCDSTGIEKPGWSLSEDVVAHNIDGIIKAAQGRLFISAFSSQVERLIQFIESAKRHGKKVAFEGRSIKSNMAIAQHLKLTDFSHIISIKEIHKYAQNKVVVLLTGAQGEQFAALNRVANGTHRDIKLVETDTVVLSSSIVPGNAYQVQQLKNRLYAGSYNIITYSDNKVHASGHGCREELLWIHNQVNYKFFMPIHGEPYMIRMHAKFAKEVLHVPEENIVVADNGSIIEIRNNGTEIVKLDQKIPNDLIIVDGTYQGPLHEVVMNDRKTLSESGMFVVVVTIDPKTGRLRKSSDIISRGFVYLRESKKLLANVRTLIKRSVETHIVTSGGVIDFDDIKKLVADRVEHYLLQKTDKQPIVIPVILSM